jgi:nucleoside-diphosphate-sugar epimerase
LVTGAGGFVGANLARRLLSLGHEVHIFTRPQTNLWRLEGFFNHLHNHTVDLRDGAVVQKAVADIQPEWIFHLAVFGAYPFQSDVETILQTNIWGTSNLIQACAAIGFEAFVNTGSSSEYGYKAYPPSETEWLEPNSYYAVAKASCTLYCRYTAQKIRRPITTLRLYSVYGAYEESSRLLPTLIKYGLAGQLPPLAAPETARDFVYIDDVVDAYLKVAETPDLDYGEVFNVGTGIQRTLREVVEVAREVMGIQQQPNWGSMESRHWDTNQWVADISHIRERLGWEPRVGFEEGFTRMVAWFREHADFYAS